MGVERTRGVSVERSEAYRRPAPRGRGGTYRGWSVPRVVSNRNVHGGKEKSFRLQQPVSGTVLVSQ